jgi:Ca2+-binding RTX toxin-like protein
MAGEVISVGGGNYNIAVFGTGTVIAGDGNDTIAIVGAGSSILAGSGADILTLYSSGTITAGNGPDTISIGGAGTVHAGNGDDSISVSGGGKITVGDGSDTISLTGTGVVSQVGASGHDTISLGYGNDTIYEAGAATVTGPFGTASIDGGGVTFSNAGYGEHAEAALSGNVTLVGGIYLNQFVAGSGTELIEGGAGPDTFTGGTGHDTMVGGGNSNLFQFLAADAGGQHVITNFVSGEDQLYLEGHTLAYLTSHGDITVTGGNTYISLDDGKTTVELKGFTGLSGGDIKH